MVVAAFRIYTVAALVAGVSSTAAFASDVGTITIFKNGDKTNADDVNSNFTTLKGAVNDNHGRIGDIILKNNAQDVSINSLRDTETTQGTDIGDLKKEISALRNSLSSLSGQRNIVANSTFVAQTTPTPAFPDGWASYPADSANLTITAVAEHPYTKAFIGPYTEFVPSLVTNDPEGAIGDRPYWYGVYNSGPRINRWGWGALQFKLLHVTISGTSQYGVVHSSKPADLLVGNAHGRYHFRGYVKIIRGVSFGVSQDVGASQLMVSKTECDQSPQGWCLLEGSFEASKSDAVYLSFGRPAGNTDPLEVLVALPYFTVEDPLWRDQ